MSTWLLMMLLGVNVECDRWGEWQLLGAHARVVSESAGAKSACGRYLRATSLAQGLTSDADVEATLALREAAQLLDPLRKSDGLLGDWAKLWRARVALRSKDIAYDIASWRPSPALLATSEFTSLEAAFAFLRRGTAPEVPPAAAGDARLAQLETLLTAALKAPKRPSWQVRIERELFVEYPDAKLAPLTFPEATLADLVRRAGVLAEKHMNADVLKTAAAARTMAVDPASECALAFYVGAAQRKLRKYDLAEDALLGALTACSKDDAGANRLDFAKRAHFLLGQVQLIARQRPVAEATLHRFVAQYGADSLADDAVFAIGAAQAKAGDFGAAIQSYERVVQNYGSGDQCDEAAFRSAYLSFQLAQFEAAQAKFDAIANGVCDPDEVERARAMYWAARMRERQGAEGSSQRERYKAVVERSPLSYYALLARERLGGELPLLTSAQKASTKAASLPSAKSLAAELPTELAIRARALIALGLYREAQDELLASLPQASDEQLLAYARMLLRAKQFHRASWLFRTRLKGALAGTPISDPQLWELAYPRPFAEVIAHHEQQEGLPSDFLLSLIREESAFQLGAASWANAYGLTQLLVDTAIATARDMKSRKMPTSKDLREDVNLSIQLGAHHLAMLKRKITHPALILAAYNSGQGNVTRWLKARGEKPLDEFVEEIPLDETRGYVKRILRTWNIYRVMSEKKPLRVSLDVNKAG